MQALLFTAGVLALGTGLVHSVLGEILIFRHLRANSLVPGLAAPPLSARRIRIIWATWHLASVFGWAFAGILIRLAIDPVFPSLFQLVLSATTFAYLGGGLLVLVGTRGRHPGWIALLVVAALVWAAGQARRSHPVHPSVRGGIARGDSNGQVGLPLHLQGDPGDLAGKDGVYEARIGSPLSPAVSWGRLG